MAVGNAINQSTTGITGFTGTAFTGTAVTQYNVLLGAATSSTLTNVAPSATSGVPLVSNGAAANPSFTTASVAGGGTGATSFTAYSIIAAGTTSTNPFQNVSGVGTSAQVLTSNGAGALPTWQAASKPPEGLYWHATKFDALETAFAPLVQINGTTVRTFVRAFDQTTEEFVNFNFNAPSDINTSGTVTFRVFMYASTAAAAKFVQLKFYYRSLSDSGAFDGAYSTKSSGDIAIDATQGDITIATWTETVTNLAWTASQFIFARLSRIAPAGANLASDLYILGFEVSIPRS